MSCDETDQECSTTGTPILLLVVIIMALIGTIVSIVEA